MTDGEPEPFQMSTGSDDEIDEDVASDASLEAGSDDGPATDDGGDDDADGGAASVESIADLIDEASRTAAEQAVQEAIGEAPVDRSAEVWGPADDDVDDVWSEAAERHSGERVFDDVWGATDDVWDATPGGAAAADEVPDTHAPADDDLDDEDDEPEVYTFPIADEPEVTAADDLTSAVVIPRDALAPAEEGDASSDEDPLVVLDEVTEDDDSWADQAWSDRVAAADAVAADDDEVSTQPPEPFQFAAGPQTSAPAEVPDHVAVDDEREPDAFTFAVNEPDEPAQPVEPNEPDDAAAPTDGQDDVRDDDARDEAEDVWDAAEDESQPSPMMWDEPDAADADAVWEDGAADADDDVAWAASATDPGDETMAASDEGSEAPAAAGVDELDDGAWIFDVGDRPTEDAPAGSLAEVATPRPDTGWNDLEDEHHTWSLPAPPAPRVLGDEDEPDGFTASIDDTVPATADQAVDASAAANDVPEVQAESEELQDALGDLLGAAPAPAPPAGTSQETLDQLDDLDDVLADLDDVLPAPEATPADAPLAAAPPPDPASAPAPAPSTDLAAAPPPAPAAPTPDAPAPDAPAPDAPAPAAAAGDPADDVAPAPDDEAEQDDAPPAATPAGLTFSSAKKKKRGLFG